MTIFDVENGAVEIGSPDGGPAALDRCRGAAVPVVDAASRCGR